MSGRSASIYARTGAEPRYPDVNVELTCDFGLTNVVAERFDAGVRLGEQVAKDMIAVRIGSDVRMAAVAAPDYFASHPPPRRPQDLAEHRCVNLRLPTAGGLYAWEFERAGRELKVRVEGQFAANGLPLAVRAARAGIGVAFVPEDLVEADVQAKRLVRVLADWCLPFFGYHLYYPSRRQATPAFSVLVEALSYRDPIGRPRSTW
jgi:DNA-binding transcriptional LysR family regulator